MSPEQAAGGSTDGRSDLFALGVVGHLALSGQMPASGTPLARLSPHAPHALIGALDRCLMPAREQRFASGREIAEALDRAGGTELPAPIRMWLHRGQSLKVPLALWTLMSGAPFVAILFTVTEAGLHFLPLFLPLVTFGVPWTGYFIWRLYQARRLLSAGYGLADIQYGLAVFSAQRAEELAFEHRKGPTPLGRALRKLTIGSVISSVVLLALIARFPGVMVFQSAVVATFWGSLVGALLGMAIPGKDLRVDRAVVWRQRVWRSALGRWMIKLAGWRLQAPGSPEQAVHRPTELALGHAADLLYQALPPATRRELEGLPETIALLSAHAAELRQHIEELDGLRGEVPTRDGEARGALEEARVLWRTQFTETVGALEALRLGLLRLHNGVGEVAALATDLAQARTRMERPAPPSRGAGRGRADQPFNFSCRTGCTPFGSAFPWLFFMTCPTKNPISLVSPPR